jgi:hypothetical protein
MVDNMTEPGPSGPGGGLVPPTDDPAEALAAVVSLRRLADQLERAAVAKALDEGWTWAQIAEALGITRQGAHKRHAHTLPRR